MLTDEDIPENSKVKVSSVAALLRTTSTNPLADIPIALTVSGKLALEDHLTARFPEVEK